MRINIPTVGARITLEKEWTFKLVRGLKNFAITEILLSDEETKSVQTVTLAAGAELEIKRIIVHEDTDNSWLAFKTHFKGHDVVFWALLVDVNNIEYVESK